MLRHASRHRRRVLITSTSEVYGKSDERAVPRGRRRDRSARRTAQRWAYAASKMVDEFLALAYWIEKRLPVVIARLFNTVGARQTGRYGMVIPRLVAQALRGEPLTVYGDGEQSRCFGSVKDAVRRPRPPHAVRRRDRRGRQRRQPGRDHDQRRSRS